MARAGRGPAPGRRSWLARLEAALKQLVGPAQLGRHDEPAADRQLASRRHRDAHAQAWETVVDSSGRRYVRARRGGPEDREVGRGPAGPGAPRA